MNAKRVDYFVFAHFKLQKNNVRCLPRISYVAFVTQKKFTRSLHDGRVEKIVPGGLGLLRDDRGVFFVRGVLPGERVQLSGFSKKGGARFGHVQKIIETSKNRRQPDCDAHPKCGGCDFLDFNEIATEQARHAMVSDALARIGRLSQEELTRIKPLMRSSETAMQRRRVQFHTSETGKIGYFARESHQLVERHECHAIDPALNELLSALAQDDSLPKNGRFACAVGNDNACSVCLIHDDAVRARQFGEELVRKSMAVGVLLQNTDGEIFGRVGNPTIFGEVACDAQGGPYQSDAGTFTQATRFGAREIVKQTKRALEDCGYEGGPILELFAGAGHITFSLAEIASLVMAVEGAIHAVDHMRANIDRSPFGERIQCIWGDIDGASFGEDYVDVLLDVPEALVLDPPRNGVIRIDKILEFLKPPILVMISCDLATGARDLRLALEAGYELVSVVPIDAFPRTSHTEWVAALKAR